MRAAKIFGFMVERDVCCFAWADVCSWIRAVLFDSCLARRLLLQRSRPTMAICRLHMARLKPAPTPLLASLGAKMDSGQKQSARRPDGSQYCSLEFPGFLRASLQVPSNATIWRNNLYCCTPDWSRKSYVRLGIQIDSSSQH